MVYFLLKLGYKIASKDIEDYPLHRAIYENSISDLIELLYNGGNGNRFCLGLEDCDIIGNTPLLLAVKTQNIEAIAILLEYCADPSNQPSHRCKLVFKLYRVVFDPILEALILKDKEVLRLLLKAEDRNRQMQFSRTKILLPTVLNEIPDFSMVLDLDFNEEVISITKGFVKPECYKVL